jgi:hypothetical protein
VHARTRGLTGNRQSRTHIDLHDGAGFMREWPVFRSVPADPAGANICDESIERFRRRRGLNIGGTNTASLQRHLAPHWTAVSPCIS